jgi:hypothetical protein
MSLLGKIAALFSGGSARKVCVVDGDRLVGGDRVGPGERFQALNRLARYAAREEIAVKVVFGGRPLREADEGADYNGVQVFYAESPAEVREKLNRKLASVGTSKAIFVTSDQAAEVEMRERGYATMRISTLRKAMEPGDQMSGGREGGGGGRDRDGGRRGGRDRRDRRERRDRRPQDDQRRENVPAEQAEGQNRPAENQPSAQQQSGGGSSDAVKNLIDLVE